MSKNLFSLAKMLTGGVYGFFLPESMKIENSILTCGAKLITRTIPGCLWTKVYANVSQAGSGYEAEGNFPRGTAHFLEHVCCDDSVTFGKGGLQKFAEKISAQLNGSTGFSSMDFIAFGDAQHRNDLIHIISAMMAKPLFDEESLEITRGVILSEWLSREWKADRSFEFVQKAFQTVYGNTPFMAQVIGQLEDIKTINLQHLTSFHARKFLGEAATIVVEGPVRHDKVRKQLEAELTLPKGKSPQRFSPPSFVPGEHFFAEADIGGSAFFAYPRTRCSTLRDFAKRCVFENIFTAKLEQDMRKKGKNYAMAPIRFDLEELSMFGVSSPVFPDGIKTFYENIGSLLAETASTGCPEQLKNSQTQDRRKMNSFRNRYSVGAEEIFYYMKNFGHSYTPFDVVQARFNVTLEDVKAEAERILDGPWSAVVDCASPDAFPENGEIARLVRSDPKGIAGVRPAP